MSRGEGETKLRVLEKKTPESCGVVKRELTPSDRAYIRDNRIGNQNDGKPTPWDCVLGSG